MSRPKAWCPRCEREAHQIETYVLFAEETTHYERKDWEARGRPQQFTIDGELVAEPPVTTPDDYVWNQEGTLDQDTGLFLCDDCYIAVGMPSAPGGWKATLHNLAALGLVVGMPTRLDQVHDHEMDS